MKQPFTILKWLLAAILLTAVCAKAQTNTFPPYTPPDIILQEVGQDFENATNYALVFGGGHSYTGIGRSLGFAEFTYNFNNYVGLALGDDYLFGNNKHQFNSLAGGVTLQLKTHPFAFIGSTFLTNVAATPFGFDQMATSQAGTVANLLGAGVDFDVYDFGNFGLHVGALYEKRTGDPIWDADYLLFEFALSRNF